MMDTSYWTRSLQGSRTSRRRLFAAGGGLAATATAAALVGCSDDDDEAPSGLSTQQAGSAPAKRGGTLRQPVATAYPSSFDPNFEAARPIVSNVYSRLFKVSLGAGVPYLTNKVEPDAAESVEQPDATTLVIKLRPNARWQAPLSRAVTPEDVAFSFDRYVGNIAGIAAGSQSGDTKRFFETPRPVDARTVRINLRAPIAAPTFRLANTFTFTLVPTEADKTVDLAKQAVGSGPRSFLSGTPGSVIRFGRNDQWHLGPERPYIDVTENYNIPEYAVQRSQLLAGNLETVSYILPGDVPQIRSTIPGVQFTLTPQGDPTQMSAISFSSKDTNPPWKDARVRQAVSMAIDRDAMTEAAYGVKALQGLGLPAKVTWNGFLPAAMEDYWVDPKGEGRNKMDAASARFFKFDPDGAKKLLAEAGFPDGFGPVKLHFVNQFGAAYPTLAELTAGYLGRAGIRVTLTLDDYQGVYLPRLSRGDFDGLSFHHYGTFTDPGEVLSGMYVKGGIRNTGFVDDPDVTRQVEAIESNQNEDARRRQILDIQNTLAQKMYYVPMQGGSVSVITAYQPFMRNVVLNEITNGRDTNYWWMDK